LKTSHQYETFKGWKSKNFRSSITPKEFACNILAMERPYKNQGNPLIKHNIVCFIGSGFDH
jgi:hypothetical protein